VAGPILLCTDGSDLSDDVIAHAFPLLRAATEVVVATVVEPADPTLVTGTGFAGGVMTPETLDELQGGRETDGRAIVERAAARLGTESRVTPRVVTGEPGQAICDLAREIGASVVVIGSRGHGGLRRALLGSVSDHVVRNATCPVLIARATEHGDG